MASQRSRMSRTILGAALALACASAAHAQGASSLDGEWTVVEAERALAAFPNLVGAKASFRNGHFTIDRSGRSKWEGSVKADPSGKIDMVHEGYGLVPPLQGDRWEGIYRVKGQTLEIVTAQGKEARPTEFLPGFDLLVMKLRRQ